MYDVKPMKLQLATLLLLVSSPSLWANNAALEDEYYSSDIYNAIKEAKVRTHHYDYSNSLRYNRTTSQSIQIPRLLNQEMAITIIETPEVAPEEISTSNASNSVDKKLTDTPAESRLVQNTGGGSFSTPGVSVRAYSNP